MSKRLKLISLILGLVGTSLAGSAVADSLRPTVIVAPTIAVVGDKIYLKDISNISTFSKEQESLGSSLSEIFISDSPAPLQSLSLEGKDILERLKATGISTDAFGYRIPKNIHIVRKGRQLEEKEVRNALVDKFSRAEKENIKIKGISLKNAPAIPIGRTSIRVKKLGEASSGRLPIRVQVSVDNKKAARFLAHANIDLWQEVPVITRSLDRGMLISKGDIQLIRVNLNQKPADLVINEKELVGKRVKSRLLSGDTVRRAQVDIPPTVVRGSTVSIIYRRAGIQASAMGQATTDGLLGETISVINTSSKRVVRAVVKNSKEVEVENR